MMKRIFKRSFCSITSNEPIISKLSGNNNNILGLYLNNPKTKNALSKNLLDSLKKCIDRVTSNNEIRVVYLISGEPGYFCTGADLKERAKMNEREVELFVKDLRKTFFYFSDLRVPSICAIDGFALGGGLELALSCDIRIMTKKSTIGLTECALGIIPGAGGTQRLPGIVGVAKAKELIYTAERLSGEEALRIGLTNHVVDSYENLEAKVIEIAEKIVKNAPLAVTNAKKAINNGFESYIKNGLKIEELCYGEVLRSEDRLEGIKAFGEKRTPQYTGK